MVKDCVAHGAGEGGGGESFFSQETMNPDPLMWLNYFLDQIVWETLI